jgi:hypothetical protein
VLLYDITAIPHLVEDEGLAFLINSISSANIRNVFAGGLLYYL